MKKFDTYLFLFCLFINGWFLNYLIKNELPYIIILIAFVISLLPFCGKIYLLIEQSIRNKMYLLDFKNYDKNLLYYRDIINDYSIGELTFIDGYDLDYPKDIIAVIIKLQLLNRISINDNVIKVINSDTSGLKESEKYIMSMIHDGIIVLNSDGDYLKHIKNELINDGLIVKRTLIKDTLLGSIVMTIYFVLFIFLLNQYHLYEAMDNNWSFFVILLILFGNAIVALGLSLSLINRHSWKLTSKGKDLNTKLRGLRNFLLEFSEIDDKDEKHAVIWEDYLLYSVMFGINKRVIKNLSHNLIIKNKENVDNIFISTE